MAVLNGVAVRPMKYTKTSTMVNDAWWDYAGRLITDQAELDRIIPLATDISMISCDYDDHDSFMTSVNYSTSPTNLPVDRSNIVVTLQRGNTAYLSMGGTAFDGDEYQIWLKNPTDVDIEVPFGTGDNIINLSDMPISVEAGKYVRVNSKYIDGKWLWYPEGSGTGGNAGVNYVNTLQNMPVNRQRIVAEINAVSPISFSKALKDGNEYFIVVRNTGITELEFNFPVASWLNMDGDSFIIQSGESLEIDIVYINGIYRSAVKILGQNAGVDSDPINQQLAGKILLVAQRIN